MNIIFVWIYINEEFKKKKKKKKKKKDLNI